MNVFIIEIEEFYDMYAVPHPIVVISAMNIDQINAWIVRMGNAATHYLNMTNELRMHFEQPKLNIGTYVGDVHQFSNYEVNKLSNGGRYVPRLPKVYTIEQYLLEKNVYSNKEGVRLPINITIQA